MDHNGVILASFQYTSAVNLNPEEWILLATQYHHWGLPHLHTQWSLAGDHKNQWNSCLDLHVFVFCIWVMTSVLHLNQVVQQSNRKHIYIHSFNCIVPAKSGTGI